MTGTNDGNRPKVYQSLREQLRQFRPDMPPGEGAIADLILNFPGELAGYSASELALLAKTSKATVSRFVRRLGFDKFEDMRRLIRAESEAGSPLFLTRGGGQTTMPQASDLQAAIARNTSETLAGFDEARLDRLAARVLSSRQVWIIGYRHGHFLAGYLRWSLAHARNGVHLLPRAVRLWGKVWLTPVRTIWSSLWACGGPCRRCARQWPIVPNGAVWWLCSRIPPFGQRRIVT